MVVVVLLDKRTLRFQNATELVVRLLNVFADDAVDKLGEVSVDVHRTGNDSLYLVHNPVGHTDAVVVISKGGGLLNNAGTRVVCDVGVGENAKVGAVVVEIVEERDVAFPREILSFIRFQHG